MKGKSKGVTGIQKTHLEASKQICLPGTEGSYKRIINLVALIPFTMCASVSKLGDKYWDGDTVRPWNPKSPAYYLVLHK